MTPELEQNLEEINRRLALMIERRFRMIWIVFGVACFLIGLSIGLGQINNRHRIQDNRELIGTVRILAQEADARSQSNSNQDVIARRRICADGPNQKDACQALFDRLAAHITARQRFRLACDVLYALHLPTTNQLRKQAKCPDAIVGHP